MFMKEVTVTNTAGLYSRPATLFIQKANTFRSSIWLENKEKRANGKSLLGLFSLGISQGNLIKIIADGPDESLAVNQLVDMITSTSTDDI